jgi:hypothetical protein
LPTRLDDNVRLPKPKSRRDAAATFLFVRSRYINVTQSLLTFATYCKSRVIQRLVFPSLV